jgi:hypothetical protein
LTTGVMFVLVTWQRMTSQIDNRRHVCACDVATYDQSN